MRTGAALLVGGRVGAVLAVGVAVARTGSADIASLLGLARILAVSVRLLRP